MRAIRLGQDTYTEDKTYAPGLIYTGIAYRLGQDVHTENKTYAPGHPYTRVAHIILL